MSNVAFKYLFVRMINFADPKVSYDIPAKAHGVSILSVSSSLKCWLLSAIVMHLLSVAYIDGIVL